MKPENENSYDQNVLKERALEGTIVWGIISYLTFRFLILMLNNLPSGDFSTVIWGTIVLFSSTMLGSFFALFLFSLYFLLQKFTDEFFTTVLGKRIGLIFIIFIIGSFLISFLTVIFAKPIEVIENIWKIIASLFTIGWIIYNIIKEIIRTKK